MVRFWFKYQRLNLECILQQNCIGESILNIFYQRQPTAFIFSKSSVNTCGVRTQLLCSHLNWHIMARRFIVQPQRSIWKKLQSLDNKAIKLALGLPVRVSTICSYREDGILPFDEYRKLAAAKYVIRASKVDNYTNEEYELKSDVHIPKRSNQTPSLSTLASYTSYIREMSNRPKACCFQHVVHPYSSVGAF